MSKSDLITVGHLVICMYCVKKRLGAWKNIRKLKYLKVRSHLIQCIGLIVDRLEKTKFPLKILVLTVLDCTFHTYRMHASRMDALEKIIPIVTTHSMENFD